MPTKYWDSKVLCTHKFIIRVERGCVSNSLYMLQCTVSSIKSTPFGVN